MQSLQLANDEVRIKFEPGAVTIKQEEEDVKFKIKTETISGGYQTTIHDHGIKSEEIPIPKLEITNTNEPTSLRDQLIQHCEDESKLAQCIFPGIKLKPNYLKKLVQLFKVNMVVVSLYPIIEGYTIALRSGDGVVVHESRHPYTQDALFSYINHGHLPPSLVNEWDVLFPQVFYKGCVVLEIKDFRYSKIPLVNHVMLKPHTESLVNDVMQIINDGQGFSNDDKNRIENTVMNSCLPSLLLNLDPCPDAGFERIEDHFSRNYFNTERTNYMMSKHSDKSLFRKRKATEERLKNLNPATSTANRLISTSSTASRLNPTISANDRFNPTTSRDDRLNPTTSTDDRLSKVLKTLPKENAVSIAAELKPFSAQKSILDELKKVGMPIVIPDESSDDAPHIVEQYILERETLKSVEVNNNPQSSNQFIPHASFPSDGDKSLSPRFNVKLIILLRPSNAEYIGTLTIDKELEEGQSVGGLARFILGSRANATRYIKIFKKMFTNVENDCNKSVRIIHLVPGQPADIKCSPSTREHSKTIVNIRVHNNSKSLQHHHISQKIIDELKKAIPPNESQENGDDTPQVVEQYILEREIPRTVQLIHNPQSSNHLTAQYSIDGDKQLSANLTSVKLTILQKPSTSEYIGTLYIGDDVEDGLSRFTLGTKANVNRYIKIFKKLFTSVENESNKTVKIAHLIPGQPTEIKCTPSVREQPKPITSLRIHNHMKLTPHHQVSQLKVIKPAYNQEITVLPQTFRNSVQQFQTTPTFTFRRNLPTYIADTGVSSTNKESRPDDDSRSKTPVATTVSVNGSASSEFTSPKLNPATHHNANSAILTLLNKSNLNSQTINHINQNNPKVLTKKNFGFYFLTNNHK